MVEHPGILGPHLRPPVTDLFSHTLRNCSWLTVCPLGANTLKYQRKQSAWSSHLTFSIFNIFGASWHWWHSIVTSVPCFWAIPIHLCFITCDDVWMRFKSISTAWSWSLHTSSQCCLFSSVSNFGTNSAVTLLMANLQAGPVELFQNQGQLHQLSLCWSISCQTFFRLQWNTH